MLTLLFQLSGLSDGVDSLFKKRQGPFPLKSALVLEQPGPPPNHAASGAVLALFRASKMHEEIDI